MADIFAIGTTNRCYTIVLVLSSFPSLKLHCVDLLSSSPELQASGSDKGLSKTVLDLSVTYRMHKELFQNRDLKELCVCI